MGWMWKPFTTLRHWDIAFGSVCMVEAMTKEFFYALDFWEGGGILGSSCYIIWGRAVCFCWQDRARIPDIVQKFPSHLDTLDVCSPSPPRRTRLRRWDFPSRSPPSSASLPLLLLLLLLSTCLVSTSLAFKTMSARVGLASKRLECFDSTAWNRYYTKQCRSRIPPRRHSSCTQHSPCPADSFPLADFSVVGTDLTCFLSSFSPPLLLHHTRPATQRKIFSKPASYWFHLRHGSCRID